MRPNAIRPKNIKWRPGLPWVMASLGFLAGFVMFNSLFYLGGGLFTFRHIAIQLLGGSLWILIMLAIDFDRRRK